MQDELKKLMATAKVDDKPLDETELLKEVHQQLGDNSITKIRPSQEEKELANEDLP